MRGIDEDLRSPKYALVERERRFLVDRAALPPMPKAHVLIEERYLAGTRFWVRRMTEALTDVRALKLAKKYEADDPTARPMVNAYTSVVNP